MNFFLNDEFYRIKQIKREKKWEKDKKRMEVGTLEKREEW